MADLWSYSTGTWGVSRVRVYERYPGSPLHIEWTGKKPQSLKRVTGKSIRDRGLATRVANRMSQTLEHAPKAELREALGMPERRTLGELLERYHADHEGRWGKKHGEAQRMNRKYWTQRLGADTDLREINEAVVERVADQDAKREKWASRTQEKRMKYLSATFRFARRKLKWIGEREDLTALDSPRPDVGGPSFSHPEMMALLQWGPEAGNAVDVAVNITYDTQARSKAVRHLRAEDYLGDGRVRFRAEYDKAGKERVAILSPTSQWKVEARLRDSEVKRSGWLFPGEDGPIGYDQFRRWLHDLCELAGVPYVEGRGWHGIKRRSVTDARNELGSMGAVSRQAGTTEATLLRVYEQDDEGPKRKVADAMERLRRKA